MRATQILMVDHEEAMTMLDTLVNGDMAPTDVALFGRLKESLNFHARIEEELFYPALKSFPETKEIIHDSYQDHKAVERLLRSMSPGNAAWDDQIVELRTNVIRHAAEEEAEVFPQAEALLGNERLLQLGREIQKWKAGVTPVPAGGTREH